VCRTLARPGGRVKGLVGGSPCHGRHDRVPAPTGFPGSAAPGSEGKRPRRRHRCGTRSSCSPPAPFSPVDPTGTTGPSAPSLAAELVGRREAHDVYDHYANTETVRTRRNVYLDDPLVIHQIDEDVHRALLYPVLPDRPDIVLHAETMREGIESISWQASTGDRFTGADGACAYACSGCPDAVSPSTAPQSAVAIHWFNAPGRFRAHACRASVRSQGHLADQAARGGLGREANGVAVVVRAGVPGQRPDQRAARARSDDLFQ
jgi:hypothetical protein